MAKKMRSYRLEEESIERLEKIAAFYSESNNDMFQRKVPVTAILEILIDKEYQIIKSKGYSL